MPLRLFSISSEGREFKMRPLFPKAPFLAVNGKKIILFFWSIEEENVIFLCR